MGQEVLLGIIAAARVLRSSLEMELHGVAWQQAVPSDN